MASPTIESLCCVSTNNAFSKDFLKDFQSVPYNAVSVVAALCGISGALYQVLPRKDSSSGNNRGGRFLKTRGRLIIRWLAFADLMASLGILIRAASWLADDSFGSGPDDSAMGQYLCIFCSAIIHYFYAATYLWSFLYALDVKLVMYDHRVDRRLYHLFAWSLPLVLCLTGLLILYLPDLNCHSKAVNPYVRFLPNYLSSFLPIVLVMVANPVLYWLAFSKVESQIMSARGRFTHTERRVVDSLLKKFFAINAVFYICWLPNIINGIILWTSWDHLPKGVILVIWYLMAILNPLQAVFNSLVYRSWESGSGAPSWPAWLRKEWWRLKTPSPTLATQDTGQEGPVLYGESSGDEQNEGDEMKHPASYLSSSPSSHERTPLLASAPAGQHPPPGSLTPRDPSPASTSRRAKGHSKVPW